MKKPLRRWYLLLFLVAGLPAGCGDEGLLIGTPPTGAEDPASVLRQFSLPAEPVGGRGVARVCDEASDGEYVVVVGRVASAAETPVRASAAVTLVDLTQELDSDETPCSQGCSPSEEEGQSMVMVQFVDQHGQRPFHDVPHLLGVKEGQTVVVRGKFQRDADGRHSVVQANGLYLRPEQR